MHHISFKTDKKTIYKRTDVIGAFGFEFAARFELESRENWTVTNVSVFGGGQNVARAL